MTDDLLMSNIEMALQFKCHNWILFHMKLALYVEISLMNSISCFDVFELKISKRFDNFIENVFLLKYFSQFCGFLNIYCKIYSLFILYLLSKTKKGGTI